MGEGNDFEVEEARRIAENIRKGRRLKGKKTKNHMQRKGDLLEMNHEEEMALTDNKNCKLCNRETPLYFY